VPLALPSLPSLRVATGVAIIVGLASRVAGNEPLDVETYVQIVIRSHPVGRQVAAFGEAARAERKAARQIPDPTLDYSRARARASEGTGVQGTETGFSVTQTIPWPGTFSAGVQAGDRAAEALEAAGTDARWQVETDARVAFGRLASARELLEVARAAESDATSLRDLVARRAELGEAREVERIKANVEWLRQQRELRAAELEAEAAEAVVRMLAVEPLPQPLAVRVEALPPLPPLDRDSVRARLLAANPRVRALDAEAARQEALLSVARRGRIPDLDVSYFRDTELDKKSNGFSIGLRVPLWNANRGEIARATAAFALDAAEAQRARVELAAELETRLRNLEVAASQVAVLEGQLLPEAGRSRDLSRFSYGEGETSLLDLLDAQRTYRDAQRETVEARLSLTLALSDARRLLGPDWNPWS